MTYLLNRTKNKHLSIQDSDDGDYLGEEEEEDEDEENDEDDEQEEEEGT